MIYELGEVIAFAMDLHCMSHKSDIVINIYNINTTVPYSILFAVFGMVFFCCRQLMVNMLVKVRINQVKVKLI